MKLVKRISLFMTLSVVMLGLGGWGALKAEEFFYPHRYSHSIEQAGKTAENSFRQSVTQLVDTAVSQVSPSEKSMGTDETAEEQVIGMDSAAEAEDQVIEAAAAQEPVVTADTRYLLELVNLSEGTVKESEETIPVMYIGLNREELLEALSAYEDNPPLTELEQGFESMELTAFSKDRVAVCKYYRAQEPQGFYLMVADHFIVVYEDDRSTLYMNTDILLERLPDALQREIMAGKFVGSEEELYLFLESYSS
ncbi:MAG: hypothetical protein OSJ59_01360 [Lachnospiraceae bacterium]|nr:hypothetical protein [Lachnospiraceae bacterium]